MSQALEELARRPSRWLDATGNHSETVLSTRVRLARNVAGSAFTHRAREEQLHHVMHSVVSASHKTSGLLAAAVRGVALGPRSNNIGLTLATDVVEA